MLTNSSDTDAAPQASEAELRAAADQARAAVAAAPRDESAAQTLTEAVRLYRYSYPRAELVEKAQAPDVAEARRLIREDDLEAAEILLRKHLASAKNDPPAMHIMAEIAAYCGLLPNAERILDHSARLHGDDPNAMVHLAGTLHRIAVHEDVPELIYKAARVFDRALELEPTHQRALALKAEMMM